MTPVTPRQPHRSSIHARPARPQPVNWELDAALAVLHRAREELDVLAESEQGTEAHLAAQRRVQSAQQLVNRISGKMP